MSLIADAASELIAQLRPNEFCSCGHPVAELIPAARTAWCRSCGRPIRAIRNNQDKDTP